MKLKTTILSATILSLAAMAQGATVNLSIGTHTGTDVIHTGTDAFHNENNGVAVTGINSFVRYQVDISFNLSANASLITGVASADTFVDVADFLANGEITVNYTQTIASGVPPFSLVWSEDTAAISGIAGRSIIGTTIASTTLQNGSYSLGAQSGVYDIVARGTEVGGPLNTINNQANLGISLDVVRAVPEPSSAALLGLGGLALILRRRK